MDIMLTEIRAAERAHREAHGDAATDAIMMKFAGTSRIKDVPADQKVRRALLDALAVADDDVPEPAAAEAEIKQLCIIAGRPELAAEFIQRGKTPAAVAKQLQKMAAAKPRTIADVGNVVWPRFNRAVRT